MNNEILLTGGRPTGKMHIGHYVGAFKNYIDLQDEYDNYFVLSDIHMLTTAANKKSISSIWDNSINMIIDVLAMGVKPEKTIFYLQSNITEMPYYYTIIQNFIDVDVIENTPSLKRTINEMKINSSLNEISLGLLAYPVMEAADILLMNADKVTVGKDNIDHVKITRRIVDRINQESDNKLKKPTWISTAQNNILGIDGQNKMSKSLNNCIYISDSSSEVKNKVDDMPWISNENHNVVIKYLELFTPYVYNMDFSSEVYHRGEAYCKKLLITTLEDMLFDMRNLRKLYESNKDYIEDMLIYGTEKVKGMAHSSLNLLKEGLGYNKYCIW